MLCSSNYPPQEEYLLEKLLHSVTSYALSKVVYVVPNGEHTAPFLAALEEAGFSHRLIEPGAVNGHNPVADLQQALNPRRYRKPLAEIVREAKEYALGRERMVRVIPSEQTPLLLEALEKEGISYYIAQPKSFFKREQEYEINLLGLELGMEG